MASTTLLLTLLVGVVISLPYRDQLALVNSLEVGRNQDPNAWTCVGCDDTNRPLTSRVIQNKDQQIKSILSVYEQYSILAFRYTANLKNLWQDILWAFQVQDEHAPAGCKVQREYDRMWGTIKDQVLTEIAKATHTGRLVITGISLGGGLACISYVDIMKSGIFQNVEIVTFGAPRVGNRNWADWFNTLTPSRRYFLRGDPIAYLPRCLTPICNYKQTGTPAVCDKIAKTCTINGKQDIDVNMGTVTFLANQMMEHNGDLNGIIDHIYGYKNIKDYTLIE